MFVWSGDPTAFTIGVVSLRWYGILFALGFIIGYFMMVELFKRARYNTNDLDRLLVYIFVGTVIGARLGHCLIYEPDFYLSHPIEILKIWHGGLASHGGTVGVLIAFFIFIKRNRQYSFLEIGDMLCIPIAMVCCFIRLGNFMNSEILGKPTNSDFGVVFARLGEDFPRYPAQLFEASAYLLTFVVLSACYFAWKKRPRGFIIAMLFFFIYASRFIIEPLKEEQADYSTGMILNVGQLLSIPFVLGAILLAWYVWKFQPRMSEIHAVANAESDAEIKADVNAVAYEAKAETNAKIAVEAKADVNAVETKTEVNPEVKNDAKTKAEVNAVADEAKDTTEKAQVTSKHDIDNHAQAAVNSAAQPSQTDTEQSVSKQ